MYILLIFLFHTPKTKKKQTYDRKTFSHTQANFKDKNNYYIRQFYRYGYRSKMRFLVNYSVQTTCKYDNIYCHEWKFPKGGGCLRVEMSDERFSWQYEFGRTPD